MYREKKGLRIQQNEYNDIGKNSYEFYSRVCEWGCYRGIPLFPFHFTKFSCKKGVRDRSLRPVR